MITRQGKDMFTQYGFVKKYWIGGDGGKSLFQNWMDNQGWYLQLLHVELKLDEN